MNSIRETVPQAQFQNWFKPLEYIRSDERTILLGVPSRFHEEWVRRNYAQHLTQAIRRNCGSELQLEFEILVRDENVEASHSLETPVSPTPNRPSLRVIEGHSSRPSFSPEEEEEIVKPNLPSFTHSFIELEYNRVAYQCAELFLQGSASSLAQQLNPLVLCAGIGMGKTHLLAEIGEKILRKSPRTRVRYTNFESFTSEVVQSLKTNTNLEFKKRYREETDVLLFDDIHGLSRRTRTQEELLHIFNEILARGGRVAFTTSVPIQRLPDFIEPLRSRLLSGLIAEIRTPTFQERIELLGRFNYSNQMNVDPTVLHTLADKHQKDIRELIGTFLRVHLQSKLENRVLDGQYLAREGLIRESHRQAVTLEEIISLVEHNFAISREELKSKSRKSLTAWARQVAMYLARRYTLLALEEIGKTFGRDHATVIHAFQKVTETMKEQPTRRYEVEFLIQKLESRGAKQHENGSTL